MADQQTIWIFIAAIFCYFIDKRIQNLEHKVDLLINLFKGPVMQKNQKIEPFTAPRMPPPPPLFKPFPSSMW